MTDAASETFAAGLNAVAWVSAPILLALAVLALVPFRQRRESRVLQAM
ncbi:hypothetical protein ACFXJ8_17940 [Nonomuraea sp. NPDC059194]